MANSNRRGIQQRQRVNVDERTGGIRTVARTTGAMGSTSSSSIIHTTSQSDINSWAWLAGKAFTDAIGAVQRVYDRRMYEKEKALNGVEAEMKARQESIDRVGAAAMGTRALYEIEEKSKSGEWGLEEARDRLLSDMREGNSAAFSKAYEAYAVKSLGVAEANNRNRIQEELTNNYMSTTRQSLHGIYESYTPETHDTYMQARNEIFQARPMDITGESVNKVELETIVNLSKKYASSDPAKALALIELAEQNRPDGSPSLAASIPEGYTRLQTLRDHVADAILKESEFERVEAQRTFAEMTQENFMNTMTTLTHLNTPEEVKEWTADNLDIYDDDTLRGMYGDHRVKLMNTVMALKENRKPEGNEEALLDWTQKLSRGQGEWLEIENDNRLNDLQKAKLYSQMQNITQQRGKGYLVDSDLAMKLLNDLESSWSESVYSTPWAGSRHTDPGKQPMVTPEGNFYQGELLKRLQQIDPEMNVTKANAQKLAIAQDIHNEIISGRLRWNAYDSTINEPVPELKLSEKIKEGVDLTDREVSTIGKAFNNGGTSRIMDMYGVDLFSLSPEQQKRIAGEAQRQKAELESLKSQSFWGDIPNTDEFEMQRLEESQRLTVEAMELNRLLWSGEDIKIDG